MFNPQNIFHLKADTNIKFVKFVKNNQFYVVNINLEYENLFYTIINTSIFASNYVLTPIFEGAVYHNANYQFINFQDNIPENHLNQLTETLKKLYKFKVNKFGMVSSEVTGKPIGSHGRWESYLLLNLGIHLDYLFESGLISSNENHDIFSKILGHCYNYPFTEMGSLLHGDLGPQNIKFYNDQLYLIDWDDAISGDPLYDLANWATFQWHSKDDEKDIFEFVKRFDYKSPSFTFWIYFLRISVAKMVILHKQGFKDLTRAKNRIDRALEV